MEAEITLPDVEGAGEVPVATLKLDARVEHTVDELASALQQTEFTAELITSLRSAWRPGANVARALRCRRRSSDR